MSIQIDVTKDVMDELKKEINSLADSLTADRNKLPTEKKFTEHQVKMFETKLQDYLQRECSFIENDVTFIKKTFWYEEHKEKILMVIATDLVSIIRDSKEQISSEPIKTENLTYIPTTRVKTRGIPGTIMSHKLYEYVLTDSDSRLRKFNMVAVVGW